MLKVRKYPSVADCNLVKDCPILIIFYCMTLCVSAVFAMALCPSVRPSDTFVHSIQTAKDIVKLLCRPGNPIILVF